MRIWAAASSSNGWRALARAAREAIRVLIAYRARARAVFLFGFAKSAQANIEDDELATLREIAAGWFKADDTALNRALAQGAIQEVAYEEEA